MDITNKELLEKLFGQNPESVLKLLSDQSERLNNEAEAKDAELLAVDEVYGEYLTRYLNKNGPLTKFVLCRHCGECEEPIPLDVCSELGYNPGVDGHLFDDQESAESTRDGFLEDWNRDHPERRMDVSHVGVYQITLTKVS